MPSPNRLLLVSCLALLASSGASRAGNETTITRATNGNNSVVVIQVGPAGGRPVTEIREQGNFTIIRQKGTHNSSVVIQKRKK